MSDSSFGDSPRSGHYAPQPESGRRTPPESGHPTQPPRGAGSASHSRSAVRARTTERADSEGSGLPLRALAMVLIALAVIFAGAGLLSLGGDDGVATTSSALGAALIPTSSVSTAPSG